jgi:predicted acetyltransferase
MFFFVEGKLAAISIGEITASGTGVVLFEKADHKFEGIYPAINKFFAEKHFSKITYINRQEDMGLDGLRKSKLSYYPAFLLQKFTANLSVNEQLKNLYKISFSDTQNYINHFFESKFNNSEIFMEKADGTVLSALYCFSKGVILDGSYIDSRFITAAATAPHLRGRQVMSTVIKNTLKKLYADGVQLIALEPYKQDYYTRYGFATVAEVSKFTAKFSAKKPLTEKHTTEAFELKTAYDNFCSGYNMFIDRSERDFANRLAEIKADEGDAVVVYYGKKPVGYYIKVCGEVEECVLSKADTKKVVGLNGKEVVVPQGDTGLGQARIINLYRFVENLPLQDGIDINIKIVDDIFCANSGIFRFSSFYGRGRLEVADSFDFEFTIGEFTKLLICGTKNSSLDKIFPLKKCFIVDRY